MEGHEKAILPFGIFMPVLDASCLLILAYSSQLEMLALLSAHSFTKDALSIDLS